MEFQISFYATIIGAIILFLFSIRKLSDEFELLFTDHAKLLLRKYTANLFSAIVIGALTTLILDSSSAVIILTIVFINAGIIDLNRGIGIALGANIGTTFQSQLFAFDIMAYSFVLLIVGFFHLFVTRPKLNSILKITFFLGLLFYSLFLIEEAVSQPEIYNQVKEWLKANELSPTKTAIAGGIFTLIIQSSGAMVGIVISLAKEGLFSSTLGIAVMMGAELGTCGNILIAAIGAKRDAIFLAIFNILFNLLAISLGLFFFDQFLELINSYFGTLTISRQIANAHILFNVLSVIGVLVLVKPYIYFVRRLERSYLRNKDN